MKDNELQSKLVKNESFPEINALAEIINPIQNANNVNVYLSQVIKRMQCIKEIVNKVQKS